MKRFRMEIKNEEGNDFREKGESFRGLERQESREMKREIAFKRYIGL